MKYRHLGYLAKGEEAAPEPCGLSKEDIDAIVNFLPPIGASSKRASEVVTEGIRTNLRELLETISLVPTREAIANFVNLMVEQHGLSLVVPGDSIGTNAGSGLSAIITQLTLNTFHRAGFSETVTALKKLENLIHAKPVRADEACIVVFQKRGITFEEVLGLTKRYVGSIVSDFVRDYDIIPYSSLKNMWLHETFLNEVPGMQGSRLPHNVFRLYLRPEVMSQQRVTITMLVAALRSYNKNSIFSVAHGSQLDGVIDIIVNTKNVASNPSDNTNILECTLFEKSILPFLPSMHVKGIPGIRVWTPVRQKVMRLVSKEKKLMQMANWYQHLEDVGINVPREDSSYYFLYLDKAVEVRTGVNIENLDILFRAVNIQIVHYFVNKRVLIVQCPNVDIPPGSSLKKKPETPSQIIAMYVSEAEKAYKEERKAIQRKITILSNKSGEALSRAIAIQCNIPRPDIVKSSEYVYAVTQNVTTKLEETIVLFNRLMATEHVDRRYSYSNNMHVMAEVLGIEVAVASQHYELYEIVTDSDTYINSSINVLIIDTIMSRGKPAGATFVGISRHPSNALAAATLERAGSIFTKKSIVGEKKSIRENVSSTICVGMKPPVGTGSVIVAKDITERNGEKHRVIDDEIPKAFMRDINYVPPVATYNLQDESNERYALLTTIEQEGVAVPSSGLLEVSDRNNVDNKRFNLLDRLGEIIASNKEKIVIADIRPFEEVSPTALESKRIISKTKKILGKNEVELLSLGSYLVVLQGYYKKDYPRESVRA
jgi:hypothetical protein